MRNVDVIRETYAAFGRGDVPAVLGAMDPSIEWYSAEGHPYQPSGRPWIGPDAILQNLFMRIGAEWEYLRIRLDELHDAGDTVVVEVRYDAKHKATGKTLDAQACHVWRLRDGKIVRFQQYVDTAQLQDVAGVRQLV
jgi:ketosteroid isomerase-like protein